MQKKTRPPSVPTSSVQYDTVLPMVLFEIDTVRSVVPVRTNGILVTYSPGHQETDYDRQYHSCVSSIILSWTIFLRSVVRALCVVGSLPFHLSNPMLSSICAR